jgi:hypothetical protein
MKETITAAFLLSTVIVSPTLADDTDLLASTTELECDVVSKSVDNDTYKINIHLDMVEPNYNAETQNERVLDEEMESISITHTLLNGKTYNRANQYKDDYRIWKTKGQRKWWWTGVNRTKQLRMTGVINDSNGVWSYTETLFHLNDLHHPIFELRSTCKVTLQAD